MCIGVPNRALNGGAIPRTCTWGPVRHRSDRMVARTAKINVMHTRVAIAVVLAVSLVWALSRVAAGASVPPSGYVLGPGDAVDIVVFGQADLSQTVTIKPDGMIALPLVGEVKAAGRTTAQLEQDLVKVYLKYLKA